MQIYKRLVRSAAPSMEVFTRIFHAPRNAVETIAPPVPAGQCHACGATLGELSPHKCDACTMEGWI